MTLADNVRAMRVAGHLTVDELPVVTWLSPALIRSIENGAVNGSAGEVQAIARHFGVTEAALRAE